MHGSRVSASTRQFVRQTTCGSRRSRFEQLEPRHLLTTFTVTSLVDLPVIGPGNAPGTLRQAIYDANQSPAVADVIQFAANLSGSINLSFADDNFWGASALVVSSPITIRGNANGITLSRDPSADEMRLFHVTVDGALKLESITVSEGLVRGLEGSGPGLPGGEGRGGAIYNEGNLEIIASTLYGSQAIGGNAGIGGAAGGARGGAIFNDQGLLTISNATLSGNTVRRGVGATVSSFGGAVYSQNGTINLRNSTLTENTASSGRGLYVLGDKGATTVEIASTIIGQSDAPTSGYDLTIPPDGGGQVFVTGSNNLIRRQNDYHFLAISSDDPLLGLLANNGGPTSTHALSANSPGINLGSNPAGLATDQRGPSFSRTAGVAPDIGAFEVQNITGPALLGDYNLNHVVDAADFVFWRKTLGSTVNNYSGADGNGNGSIDVGDYGPWRANFGAAFPATGAAVDESSDRLPPHTRQFTTLGNGRAVADMPAEVLDLTAQQPCTALGSMRTEIVLRAAVAESDDENLAILSTVADSSTFISIGPAGAVDAVSSDGDGQSASLDRDGALDAVFAEWSSIL